MSTKLNGVTSETIILIACLPNWTASLMRKTVVLLVHICQTERRHIGDSIILIACLPNWTASHPRKTVILLVHVYQTERRHYEKDSNIHIHCVRKPRSRDQFGNRTPCPPDITYHISRLRGRPARVKIFTVWTTKVITLCCDVLSGVCKSVVTLRCRK